jgi:hypothetical protein
MYRLARMKQVNASRRGGKPPEGGGEEGKELKTTCPQPRMIKKRHSPERRGAILLDSTTAEELQDYSESIRAHYRWVNEIRCDK